MKENKKIIIGFTILILIIIGLISYIVIDKKLASEKIDQAEKTLIDDVEIDLSALYQIGDTLNKFDSAFNDSNSNFFGYIYKSDNLSVKDFDNKAALYATIHSNLVGSNTTQNLVGTTVKNNFEKIFGKYLKYKPTSLDAGEYYKVSYDAKLDTYSYSSPTINNVYSPTYITHNISTSLENDDIIVIRKVFYVEYIKNDGGTDISKASIYKDSDKKELVGTLNLRNNILDENEVIGKYSSKLKTLKYTFKQQKEADYSFYSLERIK